MVCALQGEKQGLVGFVFIVLQSWEGLFLRRLSPYLLIESFLALDFNGSSSSFYKGLGQQHLLAGLEVVGMRGLTMCAAVALGYSFDNTENAATFSAASNASF